MDRRGARLVSLLLGSLANRHAILLELDRRRTPDPKRGMQDGDTPVSVVKEGLTARGTEGGAVQSDGGEQTRKALWSLSRGRGGREAGADTSHQEQFPLQEHRAEEGVEGGGCGSGGGMRPPRFCDVFLATGSRSGGASASNRTPGSVLGFGCAVLYLLKTGFEKRTKDPQEPPSLPPPLHACFL